MHLFVFSFPLYIAPNFKQTIYATLYHRPTVVFIMSRQQKVTETPVHLAGSIDGFSWSLRPLILLINIIRIKFSKEPTNLIRVILCCVAFFLNIASHLVFLAYVIQFRIIGNLFESSQQQKTSIGFHFVNEIVTNFNFSIHSIGVHLFLLKNTYSHWHKLWKLMTEMETALDFESYEFRQLRFKTITGFSYVFLMVAYR